MRIYLVRSLVNGKMYVGQTNKTLKQRWSMHVFTAECPVLHRAIEKYGRENFAVEEIHKCASREEMNFVEMFYISFLNTKVPYGYNLTDGGGGRQGFEVSQETREKISKANTGKAHPWMDQSGPKNHMFGKHISEEQKESIRKASRGNKHNLGRKHRLGKTFTEESRARIASKIKALWQDPAHRTRMSEARKGKHVIPIDHRPF